MSNASILQPGDWFNPYTYFSGNHLPPQLQKCREIPRGAKEVYRSLIKFAGTDGLCYPKISTIASEIGMSSRQVLRSIDLLEAIGLIQRRHRFIGGRKTSNAYSFRWHEILNGKPYSGTAM